MLAHFKTVGDSTVKMSLQNLDAKKLYIQPKEWISLVPKRLQMFCFHHFPVFTRCRSKMCRLASRFQTLSFSNLPAKNMPLSFEREAYPSNFHRFQNVSASCERSQSVASKDSFYCVQQ